MTKEHVIVIGAGPAGLSAGYELVNRGLRPVIIEKDNKVGGIARTETYNGYHFDIGGHRFFTKNKKIYQLWEEMLGEKFLKVSRLSRIYYQDRFFNYPLQLSNAIFNLGPVQSLLILSSYIKMQIRPHLEEETFEQWVSNRFGQRLYDTFFKAYTEKVWGIPCRQIRAEWAAQRIKGLSLMSAVTNALLGNHEAKTLISEFRYPERGPGMMWQRFQDKVESHGGEIRFDCETISLSHVNGAIESVTCLHEGDTTVTHVDHLISSIPITRLIALLDPKVPDEVLAAAGNLSYRSFIIVVLIVDRKELFPDQWIYIHSSDVRVGRIQNFKNWSAAMVPELEKTSVGMEYFCNEGDEIWSMSDSDLKDMATQELSRLDLASADDVIDSYVVRQPMAYPIYDQEYEKNLGVIKDFLGPIENLQTIGRNGLHRYNNMDHSMLTGMLAAENICSTQINVNLWEVNEDPKYLEEDDQGVVYEKVISRTFARMDKLAFASSVGCVFCLFIFYVTLWPFILSADIIGPKLPLIAQYFIGYSVSVKGAFIACAHSFVWGFVFGWLFAYLRNLLLGLFIFWVKKKTELITLKDFFDHL